MKLIDYIIYFAIQCIILCNGQGPLWSRVRSKSPKDVASPATPNEEERIDMPDTAYSKHDRVSSRSVFSGEQAGPSMSIPESSATNDKTGTIPKQGTRKSSSSAESEYVSVNKNPSGDDDIMGTIGWFEKHCNRYMRSKGPRLSQSEQPNRDPEVSSVDGWKQKGSPPILSRSLSDSDVPTLDPPNSDVTDSDQTSVAENDPWKAFSSFWSLNMKYRDDIRHLVDVMESRRLDYTYTGSKLRLWRLIQPIDSYQIQDASVAKVFNRLNDCYKARRTILFDHYKTIIGIESRFTAVSGKLKQRFDIDSSLLSLYDKYKQVHSNFIRAVRRGTSHFYSLSLLVENLITQFRRKADLSSQVVDEKNAIPADIVEAELERCKKDVSYGTTVSIRACIHTWELIYARDIFEIESFLDFTWLNNNFEKDLNVKLVIKNYFDMMYDQFRPPECLQNLNHIETEKLVNEHLTSLGIDTASYIPYV